MDAVDRKGRAWTLVLSKTGEPVNIGQRVEGMCGSYTVEGGEPPKTVRGAGIVKTLEGTYRPCEIGCEWVLL